MKKILLSGAALLMAFTGAKAQWAEEITTNWDLLNYGGFMPLCMSTHGQYLGGATFSNNAFMYNIPEWTSLIITEEMGSVVTEMGSPEITAVTDNGVAVGFDGSGAFKIENGKYSILSRENSQYPIITPNDISDDGKIVVGYVADGTFYQYACYWDNGARMLLPRPKDEELGYKTYGARANRITADGSLILGNFVDAKGSKPMILWQRQADGTYKYLPVSEGKYEPVDVLQMDSKTGEITIKERGTNPYLRFQGGAISKDGKTVGMMIVKNSETVLFPPMQVAYYDIETAELEIVEPCGMLSEGGEFEVTGLSDDRTLIGNIGDPLSNQTPFIMYSDTKIPTALWEAFPDVELMQIYKLYNEGHNNFLANAITADGTLITGYILEPDDFRGLAFVLGTKGDNLGVTTLGQENKEEGKAEYYTIDGLRLQAPVKGLNIVRNPDGTTRKIYVSGN